MLTLQEVTQRRTLDEASHFGSEVGDKYIPCGIP